jgi:hypothetical protein
MLFILGEGNISVVFFIATEKVKFFAKVNCKYFKTIFDNVSRINMNYEHFSTGGKNISPFGQRMAEIFKFFLV